MRREARHAVVLLILVALLGLGFFFPAPLSLSEEAGYHESRREEVEFAQWMTYLTEGRTRSDTAAQRTSMKPLPQLCDAVDNRTTATADFYDGLQLQRVPGPHAQLEARHADLMERLDHCRHSTPTFSPSSVNHNYEGIRQWVPMQHLNGASVERVRFRPSSLTSHVDEPLHNGITRIDYSYLNALDSTLLTPDVRLYDLPRRRATIAPRHGWKTFFVALNLYRNEVLLPYLTGALVAFLEDEVAPFANLSTSVVVSIFSNVGPDRTAQLIREFLIPHLRRIGVTEIYATTTGSCLGYLSRQPFHDRIEWMGCVRNKALQPLLTHGMQVFGDAKADQDRMAILFFNDVYFRPQDITTLLESRMEPEIASRTQPDGLLGPAVKQGGRVEGGASGTTFDLACGMDFYHTFYDRWVSRDRHGQPFLGVFPYSDDVETRRSMRRLIERGAAASQAANEQEVKKSGHHYAVPVKCCWNGVAAMRGSFFLPKALHSTAEPHNTTTPLAAPTPNNATRSGPPTVPISTPGATQYAALNTSEIIPSLDAMYTSLMLRRLLSMRIAWNKREAADAALHGRRPLPWRGSLNQLREEVQAAGRASPTYSCAQSLSFDSVMVPITNTSHDMLSCTSQHHATPLHSVPNHGTVFLKSTTPALRFRHSLVPSFGATAELRSLATVRPDVCLSSECLLICEDIAQVAMLREQRTPLILMNPNVKVAYESYHFDAVHRSWLYNAPWAFRLLTMVRRAERWSFGRSWNPLYLFVDAPDVREASARRTLGKDEGPEGEGGPEGGEDTTAADDWTWKNPGRRMELRLTGHRTAGSDAADGDANTLVGRFDVTRLSVMSCYLPADSRFTPYLVFLVRWITVGACVLLMWLLLWDVHRTIQVKRARWKSRQPAAEEEVIASGVGLTAIINESLSREEQWFLRLVELLRLPFTYLWLQACAWCPQLLLQARSGRPERVVGGTDVKMALKRGGLLSWRGLRRRLAGWLHPGSGSPLRSPQRTASTETRWASTERPFSPLGGTRSRAGGRGPLTRGGSPREFPPV